MEGVGIYTIFVKNCEVFKGELGYFKQILHIKRLLAIYQFTVQFSPRGGARNFPTGGLTLPTRWLKYGFQGTINAKNLRKHRVLPSDGG